MKDLFFEKLLEKILKSTVQHEPLCIFFKKKEKKEKENVLYNLFVVVHSKMSGKLKVTFSAQ